MDTIGWLIRYKMEYTDDYLLNRAYEQIQRKEEEGAKLVMKKPVLGITPTRTAIINFDDIRSQLNRDAKHFSEYLAKELDMDVQVNERNELVIIGKCKQVRIEKLIAGYIKSYVKCPQCRSGKTSLIKKDRTWCMICNSCNSITYK